MRLELSENLLAEFVMSVDKIFSRPKQVCITGDAGRIIFFVAQDSQQVSFSVETETKDFEIAVEAPKFISAVKQMYVDSATLNFKPKSVVLEYGDVKATLPFQTPKTSWFQQGYQPFVLPDKFLTGLTHTQFVPDNDLRFTGILIDPVEDGSIIARFNGAALAFTKIKTKFNARLVISPNLAKVAKTKIEFDQFLLSDRGFGLRSPTGVDITSTLLEDSYPQDYLPTLGLGLAGALIDPQSFESCYMFDVLELKHTVGLVSSVVGEDEQGLQFTPEGQEEETGALVWVLASKSYAGLHVRERLRSTGELRSEPRSFKLHKKTLLKALNDYSESIYLIDRENAILLSDMSGNSVTVLTKLG